MSIRSNYQHTIYACYIGYIVQAIVNNFAPLLFLTFQSSFGLSLDKVSLLVTLNFGVQLVVDLLSAKFVDKIGYRPCMIAAHVLSALGLAGLAVFPFILPNAYAGLIAAIMLYAVGGRPARGAGKPDSRGLSDRGQGGRDEPAALVLLLGARIRGAGIDWRFSRCLAQPTGA